MICPSWQRWRHWHRALVLAVLLTGWFVIIYGGCSLFTHLRSHRVSLHTTWEVRTIPYIPAAFLVYLSPMPFYYAAPFFLRGRSLDAYALAFATVTGVAGVGFLLFPADVAYPSAPTPPGWEPLARLARGLSLRYNLAPSLHVALTVLAAGCYACHFSRRLRGLLALYALLVASSTLFTHQHHVIDVLSGAVLGWAGKRGVFDRVRTTPQTPRPSPSMHRAPPA